MRFIKILAHPKATRASKDKVNQVKKRFEESNIKYSLEIGSDEKTTRQIAQKLSKDDCDTVVCLGGDGTLHGILNGIYGKELKLGIIPLGHGNDVARSLKIPKDIDRAVNIIKNGKSEKFYLGEIEKIGTNIKEYYFSVVGMGFDVRVIEIVEKQKLKDKYSSWAYNIGTIKALFSYKSPLIKAKYDGEQLDIKVMMFSIGNSTTYGGGMKITPKADPQKDFFNITYLRQMSIPKFLWHFPKVFSGKHIKIIKYVSNFNAKEIEIDYSPRGKIIADGELLDLLPAKITKAEYKQEIIVP